MNVFTHIPFSALHSRLCHVPQDVVSDASQISSPCQPRAEPWGRGHTVRLLKEHSQACSRHYLEFPPYVTSCSTPVPSRSGGRHLTWAVSPCGQVCLIGVTDKHAHTHARTHMLLKATRFILTTQSYYVLLRYVAYTIICFSMNTDNSTCHKYKMLLLYVKSGVCCFNTQYYYMLNQEYHVLICNITIIRYIRSYYQPTVS